MRFDGRLPEQARPVSIQTNFVRTAAGSCLIATGNTRVICTASVEEGVPPFRREKGQGWVTAEYAMLPAATGTRKKRDGIKKDGRSVEIQRLIGRSLRQAIDLTKLGERTITLDCDVLEADGGTRPASITGAMVALTLALEEGRDGFLHGGGADHARIAGGNQAATVGGADKTNVNRYRARLIRRASIDANHI